MFRTTLPALVAIAIALSVGCKARLRAAELGWQAREAAVAVFISGDPKGVSRVRGVDPDLACETSAEPCRWEEVPGLLAWLVDQKRDGTKDVYGHGFRELTIPDTRLKLTEFKGRFVSLTLLPSVRGKKDLALGLREGQARDEVEAMLGPPTQVTSVSLTWVRPRPNRHGEHADGTYVLVAEIGSDERLRSLTFRLSDVEMARYNAARAEARRLDAQVRNGAPSALGGDLSELETLQSDIRFQAAQRKQAEAAQAAAAAEIDRQRREAAKPTGAPPEPTFPPRTIVLTSMYQGYVANPDTNDTALIVYAVFHTTGGCTCVDVEKLRAESMSTPEERRFERPSLPGGVNYCTSLAAGQDVEKAIRVRGTQLRRIGTRTIDCGR